MYYAVNFFIYVAGTDAFARKMQYHYLEIVTFRGRQFLFMLADMLFIFSSIRYSI